MYNKNFPATLYWQKHASYLLNMLESTITEPQSEFAGNSLPKALPRPVTLMYLKQFARACATVTAAADPIFWIAN